MKKGYALATILILLGVALFGAGAIVTISTLESKISRSQQSSVNAYYVAEAGIQDALWRLNNTAAYSSALIGGTLNVSYSANNFPQTGQSFSVTMTTSPQGPGYGTVEVTGTVNYGTFTAKRRIKIDVFQGTTPNIIGSNALFGGGSLTITNGGSAVDVSAGGIYATGNITFNSATVNAGTQTINTTGSYSANNSSNVTSGGIYASNYPPAATNITTPSFDFSYYSTTNDASYTPAQFEALFVNDATVNLPGPVTYITGNVAFGNWARNKTINITGMLVINGSISLPGSTSGVTINVADPGNGKAGIFTLTSFSLSTGTWNVDGVLYTSGSFSINSNRDMDIDGAIVAGGNVSINTGLAALLTFNSTRVDATLGSSSPLTVNVQHWEEEY